MPLHLRRITRDGRWIPEIDGLRFIAIVSVFLFHLGGELAQRSGRIIPVEPRFWYFDRVLSNGYRGVSLFFVISGFILALPFARQHLLHQQPVSFRRYYLRRVTRLEPPYVVSVVLIVLMIVVWQHSLPPGYTGHILATLFYQHVLVYGTVSSVNPVTWSLEVEIQFYLVAPLVMQAFRIPGTILRRAVLLIAILAIGIAQLPFAVSPRLDGSILFYLQYFLAGLLVADLSVLEPRDGEDGALTPRLWDAAGFAALIAIFWLNDRNPWLHTVLALPLALLVLAALRSHLFRRVLASPALALVGGMCYSIYLMHFIFIAALFKITRYAILPHATFPVNLAIQVLLTGFPVLVLCTAFYVLIERPCMDPAWPKRLRNALAKQQPSARERAKANP